MLSFIKKILGPVGIVAVATLGVYALQYRLDSLRDFRERKARFDELVAQAEKSYCQNASGGAPVIIKIPLDRAAELETGLKSELVALDYLTLASVGANFWPHDRAHRYGTEGLRLAELKGDPIDIYSSNLILGHIDFIEYRETRNEAFLHEARGHFQKAKENLNRYPRLHQRDYFEGQLYVLWASNELYAGNRDEGYNVLRLAKAAWQRLPQKEERLSLIDYAVQRTNDGIPPRLPCPSQISVSPSFAEKTPPSEAIVETTQSSPELLDIGEVDSQKRDEIVAESLSERVESLEKEMNNFLEAIPRSQTPQDFESHESQRNVPKGTNCTFTIINNTQYEVWLLINGFDRNDFKLPAGAKRRFSMPCGQLRLVRREDGEVATWPASIFTTWEGSRAEPIIEITECCMTVAKLENRP